MRLNQSGSGIVQVLIIGSLVAGVSAYFLKNTQFILKKLKTTLYQEEVFMHSDLLQEYLSDHEVCTEVLLGQSIDSDLSDIGLNSSEYGLILARGQKFGTQKTNNKFMFEINAKNTEKVIYLEETNSITHVNLTYSIKVLDEVFGASIFEKRIPLRVNSTLGVIDNCFYDPYSIDSGENFGEGLISKSIRNICQNGGNLDEEKMECVVHGFQSEIIADGLISKGLSIGASGKVQIEQVDSPYYLLGFECPQGSYVSNFNEGGVVCSEYKFEDFQDVISEEAISGCRHSIGMRIKNDKIKADCCTTQECRDNL